LGLVDPQTGSWSCLFLQISPEHGASSGAD
jgi:hypothetical protein